MAFCIAALVLLIVVLCPVKSKIYDRCELATELRDVYEFPANQLATWICIANYESHFNTSAHNPGSGDHGLFQISELFWCSPGMDLACAVSCSDLKDDDIEDDVVCAKRIFRQHQRISGNGFTAWVVYNLYCNKQDHADKFLNGCFEKENLPKHQKDKVSENNDVVKKILGSGSNTNSEISKTTLKPDAIQKPTVKPSKLRSSGTTAFSNFITKDGPPSKISIASGIPLYYSKSVTFSSSTFKPTSNKAIMVPTSLPKVSTTLKPRKTVATTILPSKKEEKRENRNIYDFSNFFTTNDKSADRSASIKSRETKSNDYSFGNNDQHHHLYSMINRPDYQFTLTSHGFRFVRTCVLIRCGRPRLVEASVGWLAHLYTTTEICTKILL